MFELFIFDPIKVRVVVIGFLFMVVGTLVIVWIQEWLKTKLRR